MSATIKEFRITRYQFPRSRPIGDSQVRSDWHYMGTLELTSSDGQVGLGFFGALFFPLPPLAELERVFRTEVWPGLEGQNVQALTHRMARPRGGNIGKGSPLFGQPIDQAIWDLAAKELDLPLYRLLGGTRQPRPRLCERPRLPPLHRRGGRVLRGGGPARICRFQDQGRQSRSRLGPRAPQRNRGGGRAGRDADGGRE